MTKLARLMSSVFVVLGMVLLPAVALACPVCGEAKESQRMAYVVMSAVLTFLPLLAVGGIATWVVMRLRAADRAMEEARRAEEAARVPAA